MQVARKWTPAAVDVVAEHYGRLAPDTIARRILEHTGIRVTGKAVIVQAGRMGLDTRSQQGDLCLTDAAAEIGIARDTLANAVRRLGYRTRRRGKYRFIPDEAMPALRAMYAAPAGATISTDEAAALVGVASQTVKEWFHRGAIRGWRVGKLIRIDPADADRIRYERARAARR